jgi:hypothetical protein
MLKRETSAPRFRAAVSASLLGARAYNLTRVFAKFISGGISI